MRAMTASQLVAQAKARIENLSPEEVAAEREAGDVLLVDVRETEERARDGTIGGSTHAPRGMVEFFADPTGAYYRAEFDPDRRTILFCASGGRSALAADALQQMGYSAVAHLNGGLRAWRAAGGPIERETETKGEAHGH